MTMPLISICIPVRDDEKHIGSAIGSARSQAYPNLEILVSDNASTDKTWNVISTIEGVTAVLQPEALAMSTHWNQFKHLAKGEWILFLCSDDLLHPEAISRCQKAMLPDVKAVFFEWDFLTPDGIQSKPLFYSSSSIILSHKQHEVFIIGNNFPLSMVLIRRKILDDVGWFDESYNFCSDWHLWLKITASKNGIYVAYLADKLAYYRQHEENETGRCIKNRTALAEVIRMIDFFLSRVTTSPDRRAEIEVKSKGCIHKLALRYRDAMAAIGEQDTAEYYYLLSQEYGVTKFAGSTSASVGPPYPLPTGTCLLPN